MSKDAALQNWLDDRLPLNGELPLDSESQRLMYEGRYLARAAWHAAVKHTLAFVAAKFIDQAGDATTREARFVREWGNMILNMKP